MSATRSAAASVVAESSGLTTVARDILIESKWKHEQAVIRLTERIVSDKALIREAIAYAVASMLRDVASQQRAKFHSITTAGIDDTRGLALIAKERYLDTYQLLNHVNLGDAKKSDLEEYCSHHATLAESHSVRVRFARAILKSPKFKDGKKVRECFTELEIARLAGELKC